MNKKPITNPTEGRHFLRLKLAYLISEVSTDAWTRKVYEIETPEGVEVWLERESKPEEPKYYYSLQRFEGEE